MKIRVFKHKNQWVVHIPKEYYDETHWLFVDSYVEAIQFVQDFFITYALESL